MTKLKTLGDTIQFMAMMGFSWMAGRPASAPTRTHWTVDTPTKMESERAEGPNWQRDRLEHDPWARPRMDDLPIAPRDPQPPPPAPSSVGTCVSVVQLLPEPDARRQSDSLPSVGITAEGGCKG